MTTRPNIVLIICDQLRGDCLGFDGHPDVKTPYIDAMAAQGTYFEHAYSTCPSCIPARATLFTGKTPSHTGRVGYRDGTDWTYTHMLAQELRDAGYQTACIGKMHVHPPRMGCGFEVLRLHDGLIGHAYRRDTAPYWQHQAVADDYLYWLRDHLGPSADVDASGIDNNSWICRPWPYEERYHPTNWVAEETLRFLDTRDRTRPFFLMASFVRPHQPFDPPACYLERYLGCDLRPPATGDWDDVAATEREGVLYNSQFGCRDAQERARAMAGYYACIEHMDHQVGRILTAIENDFLTRDTVFVFTSDHGEMLFDHSLYRKGLPYQGSVRIPLIVRAGANVARAAGAAETCRPHRSTTPAALMDIMPTLLDFAGVPIPAAVDGSSLAGEVLRSEAIARPYLHEEHATGRNLGHQAIITERDKYIWFSATGREQYFDLARDPREEHNAIDDPAAAPRIAALRAALVCALEGREEGFVGDGALVPGCPLTRELEHPVVEPAPMALDA